jgi:hypothetical protein
MKTTQHASVVPIDIFAPPIGGTLGVMLLQPIVLRAFVFVVVALWGIPSGSESIFMSLSDSAVSIGRRLPDGKDAAFYRSWAQPVRDSPKNLGAGQWALETDRKTRLAYPRLVALANGASVARANAVLEAMHGRILKTAYRATSVLSRAPFGDLDTGFGIVVHFNIVKATYLSASTLSLVAIGEEEHEGNGGYVLVRGAAGGIASGKIFTINSCHEERRRPFFTFGPLLTVCDDGKLEAFRTLWREQARLLHGQVPAIQRRPNEITQEDCRGLVLSNIDNATFFSLYLMPGGLAVHNAFSTGAWENECYTTRDSPFFPVVIPWQKLAPLMTPGPLRNELLALQ